MDEKSSEIEDEGKDKAHDYNPDKIHRKIGANYFANMVYFCFLKQYAVELYNYQY